MERLTERTADDCFHDDGRTMKHRMYVGQERTEIGKVVFFTKSKAEAKLKELRGGDLCY